MFPFFNTRAAFNKYSTVHTDNAGMFSARNFFGLGRNAVATINGIIPGSVALIFYTQPYQEWGCTGVGASSNSGLTSGSTYYIKVAVNGGTEVEISFTVDSTRLGGRNGVISKIQEQLNAEYYKTDSHLNGKRVLVGIVSGDIRFTFDERKSGSTIALTTGTSGDASTNLIGNAEGVFPASVRAVVPTKIPVDTITIPGTGEVKPNTGVMLVDDGNGNLYGDFGSGSINYDTGAFSIQAFPNAEFKYIVSHTAAMAGTYNAGRTNIISEVHARSTNPKVNSKIRVIAKK